jgi:hypothetical protein
MTMSCLANAVVLLKGIAQAGGIATALFEGLCRARAVRYDDFGASTSPNCYFSR